MMKRILTLSFLVATGGFLSPDAHAQNTSGVFGPVVNNDDHGIQYRAAISDSDAGTVWGQRFHYEKAVSDNLRLRGIIATRETDSSNVDFDFLRAEAVWQITPNQQDYQAGIRFEARVRGDSRPAEIRANWINQWSFGDSWRARAILLNTLQVSNTTNGNLQFDGRFGLSRRVSSGKRLGVHAFIELGDTKDVGVLNKNEALIGPFYQFNAMKDVDIYLGSLHNISNSGRDNQLRVFIDKAF